MALALLATLKERTLKPKTRILSGLLATTAIAFGLSAQAEPGAGCEEKGPGMGMMREGMKMMGDPAARAEQRLSQLKSQLKIDAQQEPLWLAFAEKMKAEAGQGMKAMQGNMQQPMTAPERMTQMMGMMKERMSVMESASDSFKRLYDAMTPEQKAIADKQRFLGGGMMAPSASKGKKPAAKDMPMGHSHS